MSTLKLQLRYSKTQFHRHRKELWQFTRFVLQRFHQDRCTQIAASLTFTTLLSLVPLLTIALTLFSAFPVFEDFSSHIKTYLLTNLMPNTAGKVITRYMEQFTDSAMHLTTIGLILLGVTAMFMMLTIDHAFNTIWKVSQPRSLLKRLVTYWALLTLGPLLIGASLSLTSWLVSLSMGYAKLIPIFGVNSLKILPVIFTTLAFALLFRIMPNRFVAFKNAFIGALVAALAFETMNRLFGYYISNFANYKLVYGAFSSAPIFLLWIYLSWLVALLGAVITASLSHWRMPPVKNLSPAEQLYQALCILRILNRGLEQGKVSIFTDISRELNIDYETLDKILHQLAEAHMTCRTGRNGWLLLRAPEHIQVKDILHIFVIDSQLTHITQKHDPLRNWLENCAKQLEQNCNLTLQSLFSRNESV